MHWRKIDGFAVNQKADRRIRKHARVHGACAALADLDTEGIEQEIVFGNLMPNASLSWPDLEVREWVFRMYNEYLAELLIESGGRFKASA